MLWEIDWYIVQRILIDASKFEDEDDKTSDTKKPTKTEFNFNEQTADDIVAQLNKHFT